MITQLILLRHGQPELQNCLLGQTDSKLSDIGWQQMHESCLKLKDINYVISSPLNRCQQFAISYAKKNNIPLKCVENFRECDFGLWDGVSYQKLNERYAKEFNQYLDFPNKYHPPNGELLSDFNKRIDTGMNNLLEQYKGKKVLLISHGGVIRSLVAWCLKIDRLSNTPFRSFSIDYASQTHINIYHTEEIFCQLKSLNILPKKLS